MSLFGDILGIGFEIGGGLLGFSASSNQADAFEAQARFDQQIAEQQAGFALEMANTEAAILEREAAAEVEIATFNAAVALENAEWERRAGEVAIAQAEDRWAQDISGLRTMFAAGNVALEGSSGEVVSAATVEMLKDLSNIELSTQNAVRRAETQAELFAKRGAQITGIGGMEAAAVRRAGEIEAETARTTGAIASRASSTRASAARTRSFGSLVETGASLLSSGGFDSLFEN